MTECVQHLVLLAQQNRLEDLGHRFQGGRSRFGADDMLTGLLILLAVAVGVYVLTRLLGRQDRRQTYHNPRSLFRELCKAHGLDLPRRRLLAQIARSQGLAHPARLFLEPDRFDPDNLSARLRAHQPAIDRLRKQLFACDS